MTRQPLWAILCCLPEKGRRKIDEIVEMKERDGRKRKTNESEETEEIKTKLNKGGERKVGEMSLYSAIKSVNIVKR